MSYLLTKEGKKLTIDRIISVAENSIVNYDGIDKF